MRLDQIQRVNDLRNMQDRIQGFNAFQQEMQDRIRGFNDLQDRIQGFNTFYREMQDRMQGFNTFHQDMQDQIRRINDLRDRMQGFNTFQDIQDQIKNISALQDVQNRIATANPFMDFVRNNQTILDRLTAQNTAAIDQMRETNAFHQNMQDHISKLISFSHNLYPVVEKYAENLIEDLPKEKGISKQKMMDEVKRQTEDLFEELENEEIVDKVERLERFWRKVVEVPNKMPDWLKGCLIMITWDIFKKYLLPYLCTVPQNFHQATGPTTIVYKPVITIIKKAKRQGLHLPSEYRIVTTGVLNVRERPKKHSDIRGKLFAGDLVIIKKKKKNWSLVEYSNEETRVKIQGWAFTRYLRKIN